LEDRRDTLLRVRQLPPMPSWPLAIGALTTIALATIAFGRRRRLA